MGSLLSGLTLWDGEGGRLRGLPFLFSVLPFSIPPLRYKKNKLKQQHAVCHEVCELGQVARLSMFWCCNQVPLPFTKGRNLNPLKETFDENLLRSDKM